MNFNSHAFKSLPPMERVLLRSGWQGPCVVWTGNLHLGYGRFQVDGQMVLVHRFMWEHLVGPIPTGFDLDHLCRNPGCWWSDHLEPVTRGENIRRGYGTGARYARRTHCKRGHKLPPERGTCRECRGMNNAAYYAERKAARV